MQQSLADSPTPAAPSFAGLLAALTAPTPRTAWNNDDLADDVATISYEHALRTHARHNSPAASGWENKPESNAVSVAACEGSQVDAKLHTGVDTPLDVRESGETGLSENADPVFDTSKKRASITIRLSKEECEQLRKRASAAGLTMSAYLRSCTFEAETLRAQVKEVLAELRTSASAETKSQRAAVQPGWFARLMPHRHFDQRVARA